jgi:IclR family transcriptional regulator, acetate operon repressor
MMWNIAGKWTIPGVEHRGNGPADKVMTSGTQAGSQAVDRAAALLAMVIRSDDPRTFTSLVEEAGLAKSTTSRLLHALERNRLIQRDRQGSFRAGAMFAVYAARQRTVHDLVELSRPALERLAEQTGETVNFAVPRGTGVVQIAQVDGRYLLGATNWVGIEVPAHCSALGKVFYAHQRLPLPPEGPLEQRTPATLGTVRQLRAELDEVRRRGWASAWEELEVGLVAVAVPVRAGSGDESVVGAVSVSGPTARLARSRLVDVAEQLLAESRSISLALGTPETRRRKEGAA